MSHKAKRRKMPANYQLKSQAEYEAERQEANEWQEMQDFVSALCVVVSLAVVVIAIASAIVVYN